MQQSEHGWEHAAKSLFVLLMRWEWVAWAAVGLLTLAAVIALLNLLTMPSPAATRAPLCAESAQQAEELLALVRKGLDQAVTEHTAGLFRNTIAGGAEISGRAQEGLQSEARAYLHARRVITAWVIPVCKT